MKFEEKIWNPAEIGNWVKVQKNQNKKIVFTNGCFDLLHLGHLTYLQEAQKQGNVLLVAVNSDSSVKKLKGETRPIHPLQTRLSMLASLFYVDAVTWFEEETPYELIQEVLPEILLKGGDWKPTEIVGADIVLKNKGQVLSIPFLEGNSTSRTIEKILQQNQ